MKVVQSILEFSDVYHQDVMVVTQTSRCVGFDHKSKSFKSTF